MMSSREEISKQKRKRDETKKSLGNFAVYRRIDELFQTETREYVEHADERLESCCNGGKLGTTNDIGMVGYI